MVAPSRAIERGLMLPEDKPRALCEAMLPPPGGHGLVDPWQDEGKKKAKKGKKKGGKKRSGTPKKKKGGKALGL